MRDYNKQPNLPLLNVKKLNEFIKINNLHYCEPQYDLPFFLHGTAIDRCYEDLDKKLFVDNREYGSQVNFCPFCGYEAKVKMNFPQLDSNQPLS